MEKNLKMWQDVEAVVARIGMLPYFKNKITGFSVEENVPDNILWDIDNGPWEWKGLIIRNLKTAYGKFFNNKAGYISLDILPDFINLRRSIFTFAPDSEEARLFRILTENESLLSTELKKEAGYGGKSSRRSPNPFVNMSIPETNLRQLSESRFDSAMSRLQMGGYVVIADFEYNYDRQGNRYGWGKARYTSPEALYDIRTPDYLPEESYSRLFSLLTRSLPGVSPANISRLLLK